VNAKKPATQPAGVLKILFLKSIVMLCQFSVQQFNHFSGYVDSKTRPLLHDDSQFLSTKVLSQFP